MSETTGVHCWQVARHSRPLWGKTWWCRCAVQSEFIYSAQRCETTKSEVGWLQTESGTWRATQSWGHAYMNRLATMPGGKHLPLTIRNSRSEYTWRCEEHHLSLLLDTHKKIHLGETFCEITRNVLRNLAIPITQYRRLLKFPRMISSLVEATNTIWSVGKTFPPIGRDNRQCT